MEIFFGVNVVIQRVNYHSNYGNSSVSVQVSWVPVDFLSENSTNLVVGNKKRCSIYGVKGNVALSTANITCIAGGKEYKSGFISVDFSMS